MLIYTAIPSKARKKAKKVTKQRKPKKQFVEMKAKPLTVYRAAGTEHIPSGINRFLETTEPKNHVPLQYEGEMAEREKAAQEVIKKRAKTLAPAFNKGPLQPVTSVEQAKWIGRK